MAALLIGYAETGLTTAKFVRRRRSDGFFWSTAGTPAFETYSAANIANYGIAATEVGSTGVCTVTDPAETVAGDALLVKAAGASLIVSDLATGQRWQDAAGGAHVAALGLDSVTIETGLNARQALSIIASSAAGVLAGAATTTVTIAAAGVPATTRITATVTADGNRTALTLSPPA